MKSLLDSDSHWVECSEFFGIKPDIVTLAKAMGNGFPVAAVCGKKAVMELLSPKGNVYQARYLRRQSYFSCSRIKDYRDTDGNR